ncbi:MAG: heavy-metal-associated domain-containing protein [Crocinitomicaceae bacterium]|nr:heavy-metal-associated domain-containing protein [Crocinitomicaceae bacterium]MCF8433801.1 heavy-metal-associated domain-containing protein [Crocinitomicaceae bacterium]
MKKGLFLLFALMFLQTVNAQEKKSKLETVIIQTSAECGDCKDRIEEMLNYTKGIKFSELDLETKKLTVKYSTKKISLAEIKTKLSELGYDADEVKSNPESVKKLPLCCQPGGMKNH